MLQPIRFTVEEFEVSPLNAQDLGRLEHLAQEIYTLLSDEQTLRFIPEKRLNNPEEALQWLKLSLLNFHSGRNYIHLIRAKASGKIAGIIDVLSPALVREHYRLPAYPYFVEFYIKGENQGGSIMSKVLPQILNSARKQHIPVIAAAAHTQNLAAQKVLKRSGFTRTGPFDATKDLFQAPTWHYNID